MKNLLCFLALTTVSIIGCRRSQAVPEKAKTQEEVVNELISGNDCIRFERLFKGSKMEDLMSLKQTKDGGYILCGTTETNAENEYDILVIKTDCFGVTEWIKTISNNYSDLGYDIISVSTGGYILNASITTAPKTDKLISYKGQIIKLNEKGELIWKKTYNLGNSTILNKIIETSNSDFLICGSDNSLGGFVVKVDSQGTEIWSKYLGSSIKLYDISINANKNYIISGSISINQQTDIYLAELNFMGELTWSKSIDKDNITNVATSVLTLNNNEIIIGGYNRTSGISLPGFAMRLDANGNEIWYKSFEIEEVYSLSKVVNTSNNEIIAIGSKANAPNILKLNNDNGSIIWSVTKLSNTFINDFELSADGGFVMTGNLFQSAGNRDGYILKTDKNGN